MAKRATPKPDGYVTVAGLTLPRLQTAGKAHTLLAYIHLNPTKTSVAELSKNHFPVLYAGFKGFGNALVELIVRGYLKQRPDLSFEATEQGVTEFKRLEVARERRDRSKATRIDRACQLADEVKAWEEETQPTDLVKQYKEFQFEEVGQSDCVTVHGFFCQHPRCVQYRARLPRVNRELPQNFKVTKLSDGMTDVAILGCLFCHTQFELPPGCTMEKRL